MIDLCVQKLAKKKNYSTLLQDDNSLRLPPHVDLLGRLATSSLGCGLQTAQVLGCCSSQVSTAHLTQLFSHVSRDSLFFIPLSPWSGLQDLAGRDTVDRGGQHPVDDTKSCRLASTCTCMCTHVRGHTPIRSKWCVSQM